MELTNLERYLESYGKYVVQQSKSNLTKAKKNVSKGLYNSIKYKELDNADLVHKLTELVRNKSQLKLMNKNALISVSDNWTFNHMIKNYDNAISKILSR